MLFQEVPTIFTFESKCWLSGVSAFYGTLEVKERWENGIEVE
jgi:hypothetical protein